MDTKAIVGVVAGLVLLGAGVWYVSKTPSQESTSNTPAPNGSEQEPTQQNNEEASQDAGEGTLAALMGRTGSWKCTISSQIEDAPSEGTVYIAGGKVRGNFTSTVQGTTYTSHMIQADGYIHTWSDAYPQGVKMRIPEGAPAPSATGGMDYDSRVQYDCDPWATDASLFVAPTNITFMELGGGMQNLPPTR